jgi:predicted porin
MQKKLLALAIAGAMAAPLAAQAQGSNVTIYGNLKPSIDFVDDGDESGISVQTNNSLLGFKGSEDLGNGLKAIFQLESALDFDERGGQEAECDGDDVAVGEDLDCGVDGTWVRRDSWVGLSGGFGSVVIGNMFPAYKRSTDFADPFADSIGDYNNIVGAFESGEDTFNGRFTNAVHYISPNWGGFSLQATYGLNGDGDDDGFEDDSDDGEDDSFSVSGTYVWGPLTLAAAYEDQGEVEGVADDFNSVKAWKIGAGYKFGNTTLAALWANEDFGTNDADEELERDVFFFSVKHSIGKIDLMGSYTWADEFDGIDDSGVQGYALGARYNLSKRTNIMALFAMVDNDDEAFYGMDSGYDAGQDDADENITGEKIKGFSVRLQHSF